MTDQQIEKAAQIMRGTKALIVGSQTGIPADAIGEVADLLAQALADAGMLGSTRCERECEALTEWDALVAERDAALATLQRVRELADNFERRGMTHHHVVVALRAILDDKAAAE